MSSHNEPRVSNGNGHLLDAHLSLLDRQVLDCEDEPVCTVDDLELSDRFETGQPIPPDTPAPRITALLSGPVLATRMFGGRPPASELHRISWEQVRKVGTVVKLRIKAESLDITWTERWVREHIIGRIPGGHHDPQ